MKNVENEHTSKAADFIQFPSFPTKKGLSVCAQKDTHRLVFGLIFKFKFDPFKITEAKNIK